MQFAWTWLAFFTCCPTTSTRRTYGEIQHNREKRNHKKNTLKEKICHRSRGTFYYQFLRMANIPKFPCHTCVSFELMVRRNQYKSVLFFGDHSPILISEMLQKPWDPQLCRRKLRESSQYVLEHILRYLIISTQSATDKPPNWLNGTGKTPRTRCQHLSPFFLHETRIYHTLYVRCRVTSDKFFCRLFYF